MANRTRLVVMFLLARMIAFITLPVEGLIGYGDFYNFYGLAAQPGWPYFNFWVEFPPIFPFVSSLLYRIAGGQEHVYLYMLVILLTLADAGSLVLVSRLSERFFGQQGGQLRTLTYAVVLIALPYTWWYFDSLAVFSMLLGISLILDKKELRAGLALGVGFLIKLLPVIGLVALWKSFNLRSAFRIAIVTIALGTLTYAGLWLASPEYTRASLYSQAGKGSWETIWALIDGNYSTGAMAPPGERQDTATVTNNMSLNPARIPPLLTLAVFGAVGAWALARCKIQTDRQAVQAVCFAWGMFLLWTPGFSPQWMLFLIPLIILSLPEREGFLFTIVLILVNLAEWPLLLSRGLFWALNITVPVRFLIFAGLTLRVYQLLQNRTPELEPASGP